MESNHWRRKQGPTLHTAQAVLSCIPAYVRHYRSTRALISLLAVTVPTAFCNKRAIGAGTGPGSCTGGLHILCGRGFAPRMVGVAVHIHVRFMRPNLAVERLHIPPPHILFAPPPLHQYPT